MIFIALYIIITVIINQNYLRYNKNLLSQHQKAQEITKTTFSNHQNNIIILLSKAFFY